MPQASEAEIFKKKASRMVFSFKMSILSMNIKGSAKEREIWRKRIYGLFKRWKIEFLCFPQGCSSCKHTSSLITYINAQKYMEGGNGRNKNTFCLYLIHKYNFHNSTKWYRVNKSKLFSWVKPSDLTSVALHLRSCDTFSLH